MDLRNACCGFIVWALCVGGQACWAQTDEERELAIPMAWLIADASPAISRPDGANAGASTQGAEATLTAGETGTTDDYKPWRQRRHKLWAGDASQFFKGAFVGFLGHEGGHLIANLAESTHPRLTSVEFSVVPFFTIDPGRPLTRREHYITASAGFNSQHLIDEWLLGKHPNLRYEDEPFLKGLAQFNFWLSVGYAASAFASYGPDERDTRGMADALGWSEDTIAGLILTPALLDAYRYEHPDSKWAKYASRLSKAFILGLAFEADR